MYVKLDRLKEQLFDKKNRTLSLNNSSWCFRAFYLMKFKEKVSHQGIFILLNILSFKIDLVVLCFMCVLVVLCINVLILPLYLSLCIPHSYPNNPPPTPKHSRTSRWAYSLYLRHFSLAKQASMSVLYVHFSFASDGRRGRRRGRGGGKREIASVNMGINLLCSQM